MPRVTAKTYNASSGSPLAASISRLASSAFSATAVLGLLSGLSTIETAFETL
jgi:hypothetical protein